MADRVLVTGAAGMLGRDLVAHLEGRPGLEVIGVDSHDFDITQRELVLEAVTGIAPRWIIHGAAMTAVEACESDPERAFAVNAFGTRNLAEAARRVGAHMAYVSTDYVFDGKLKRPYTEWDAVGPRSVYGLSKLGGERALDPEWTIVRTAWLFGQHGPNMVRTVLRLAREADGSRRRLPFVDDQHGCPTASPDLAPVLADLALSRMPGVFHVTNQSPTTWFGLARAVVELAGLDPGLVEPISTAQLDPPLLAPRPANSVLDNLALRLSGRPLLADWHEAAARLIDLILKEET
ncbi:MAG: dTDP-4-dehydrorhamnose reductase [Acidimicrobiales bacterium]